MSTSFKFAIAVFVSLWVCLADVHAAKPVTIVASIQPLTILIEDFLKAEQHREIQVQTLMPAQASPHHFALNVSHAKMLDAADLLVWVGPEFELFLAKKARTITNVAITVDDAG